MSQERLDGYIRIGFGRASHPEFGERVLSVAGGFTKEMSELCRVVGKTTISNNFSTEVFHTQ